MWLNPLGPIVMLALGILVAPLAAVAQPTGKVAAVGVLISGSESRFLPPLREGLRVLNYIEGRNYVSVVRAAEGAYDRLPRLVAELIDLNVDIIVAAGAPAALAAKRATTTIPIVAAGVGDPVGIGLVSNLARPGGHITALSHYAVDLSAKQVEVFKQAVPTLSRIGVASALLRLPAAPDARRSAARRRRTEVWFSARSRDTGDREPRRGDQHVAQHGRVHRPAHP